MKLNRSLQCFAAAAACLLMPLTVAYGQTTTTIAKGSITCKMWAYDPVADEITTPTITFDPVELRKHVGTTGGVSYGVLSRWGTAAEVMYGILIPEPIPEGTSLAPMGGSLIDEDGQQWDIVYDELGLLTFKMDGKGRLTVTGTSFAAPPSYFMPTQDPNSPTSAFGSCTWNLKWNR